MNAHASQHRTGGQHWRGLHCTRWIVLALLCVGSSVAAARHHHKNYATDAVAGQFDYYLMSLSWSPTYCLTHPEDGAQCRGKGFGFVLHGLWPQYEAGGYPQHCTDSSLSAEDEQLGERLYPSAKLVRHEWEQHGTCSGMDAATYFRTADRATAVVRIPPAFDAPATSLLMTDDEITAAFRAANPSLPEHAMTVACSRGQLSEVRICLTRELAPRSCGRGVRSSCPRGAPVQIRSTR